MTVKKTTILKKTSTKTTVKATAKTTKKTATGTAKKPTTKAATSTSTKKFTSKKAVVPWGTVGEKEVVLVTLPAAGVVADLPVCAIFWMLSLSPSFTQQANAFQNLESTNRRILSSCALNTALFNKYE